MRTNTRALGSTLSPTCDFISKPSDFREVTSHQRHPSSPRLSCALVPRTLAIYSPERPSPGIEGSHAEPTRSHAAARQSAREKTYAQPARQLPPRWEPAVSPHRHLARSSSHTSSLPRLRTTSCSGDQYATTGSLPFVPPPAAQPARPALSCAHAGCPAGETPTAATTVAAGGWLAGAAPETPRRAESCAPTPGRRQRTWGGRRSPSSCVLLAPPPRWPDGSLRPRA